MTSRPPLVRPAYLRVLGDGEAVAERGDVDALGALVAAGGVVVLSGAGLSTDSGIPDYRGPSGALRRHRPMTFQEFTQDPGGRQRYWARSFIGWRHVVQARPNDGHRAVAALEGAGLVNGVVTQNVDGLHGEAGARRVVELHGSLDRVVCLACSASSPRAELDDRLRAANPGFEERVRGLVAGVDGEVNPDGDVELPESLVTSFVVVVCLACGADALKPDVVFFGESVPRARVAECSDLVAQCRSLLVLGSSLTVMSGYRFVLQAAGLGLPVAIVNVGPTRGDGKAQVRLDAPLGPVLRVCVDRVLGGR